jgi:hypothetical protein
MSAFIDPPPVAACRHLGARDGFEVLFIHPAADGYRLEGHSTAVEDGEAWAVRYDIAVDSAWHTRSAHVVGQSASGTREVLVERDGQGGWRVDGQLLPALAGCVDVDLEASAFTNTFPVRRLALEVGEAADAPAVYVRAAGLRVERLEQRYARLEDHRNCFRYDYAGPVFDYADVLVYDESGLIVDYPDLAARVA